MTGTRDSRPLAVSLTGLEDECPIPSTHDKIAEAHYFLHEMIRQYHHPHPFRYSLSGFLQAARSSTLMAQVELAHRDGFKEWWDIRRARMAADPDLKLLNRLRTEVVHQSVLVPASAMTVGLFQYGRLKAGLTHMKADPMVESLVSLLAGRGQSARFYGLHPHRSFCGEELGVFRKWSLPDLEGRELVAFSIACWRKLAEVSAEAHDWLGRRVPHQASCHGWIAEAATLRESEIFPEVEAAWEGDPTDEVRPRADSLDLLEAPLATSDVLHKVQAPAAAVGWVGPPSPLWPRPYVSMLLYSVGDVVVSVDTAVFFDPSKAVVSPVPDEATDQAETM